MDAWSIRYSSILAQFGYELAADLASGELLASMTSSKSQKANWRLLGTDLKHRDVTLVGCSAELDQLEAKHLAGNRIIVACDGATSKLRELGILPRVIVTDLDGNPDDLLWAANQGSTLVIHAHGDNQKEIQNLVGNIPIWVGTYQPADELATESMRDSGMRSGDGFTDGERALSLLLHFGAKSVALAAFNPASATSRHSHNFDPQTKLEKLATLQGALRYYSTKLRLFQITI